MDSLVSKKGLVHVATFPLEGTSVGPLMSTKSHISMKVRDITDSKTLQPICQIWLKLADLAETADTKVSRGRKRQIRITKKAPNLFSSAKIRFFIKCWHSVSLPSLNQFVQSRGGMVNYQKLFKQGPIEVWLKSQVEA